MRHVHDLYTVLSTVYIYINKYIYMYNFFVLPDHPQWYLYFFQPPPVITAILKVRMHCEACAQVLQKRIRKIDGNSLHLYKKKQQY